MNVVWSPRAIRHLIAIRKYIDKDSDGTPYIACLRYSTGGGNGHEECEVCSD
jgi:hypothetical protein